MLLTALATAAVWISIAALVYPYLGYPLSLWLLRKRIKERPLPDPPAEWPSVALIVSAYNEAAGIADKIANFRALDYPPERLTLRLGDDCSADATVEIARREAQDDPRIHIRPFHERTGKAGVVNRLVEDCDAELLLMSDATSQHDPAMLKRLVRRLQDPAIGVAGARLIYRRADGSEDTGEGLYWRLESFLRREESRLGQAIQPSGAGYCLRRSDFTPLPPDTLCDDFHLPLSIAATGKDVVVDDEATMVEEMGLDAREEFARRTRIGSGNYQILWRFRHLLWPRNLRLFYVYFSHKVLRWLGFLFMLTAWWGCLALTDSGIYLGLFALQSFMYGLVLVGHWFPAWRKRWRPLRWMHYFVIINLALSLGLVNLLLTRPNGRWEKAAG